MYKEPEDDQLSGPRPFFVGEPSQNYDPCVTCGLRYISRDLAADGVLIAQGGQQAPPQPRFGSVDEHPPPEEDATFAPPAHSGPGIAAWNDASAVSMAARDALGSAAGIDIPPAAFVGWMLAGYLAILVPANWALFRMLGRVEWAWIAVPVIALAGAAIVTKAANLNIGFARSQNEIDMLELQANYPRGHLTRYAALYTSLSTTYDVHFPDPYAAVQPFVADEKPRGGSASAGRSTSPIATRTWNSPASRWRRIPRR